MKNSFIKPNPHVFPFMEFRDLSYKKIGMISGKKVINMEDIKQIVEEANRNEDLINKIIHSLPKNQGIANQIFYIFTHPLIRFGSLKMYQGNKDSWLKKFNTSIRNTRFAFSILGFPFKIPNPLKTNRTMPDLGEVMALNKLENIASLVELVSGIRVEIYIITEGAFGKFVGIKKNSTKQYQSRLGYLAKQLDFTHLRFIPLEKMESYIKNFSQVFTNKVHLTEQLYQQNDPETVKKIKEAYPTILRIINPKIDDLAILMDIYNFKVPDSKLSRGALKVRNYLKKQALKSTIQYFCYLQFRDDVHFLEKEVGPTYIPLTVSPKPNRLGIIPLSSSVRILPHQGIPIYKPKTGIFKIMYLIDLLRYNNQSSAMHLSGDQDQAPFYYEESSKS
ncbi:L-tyrosine/L-tryptophan isonitrile synthase family protein [Candidatus Daviesbacteria bacterium]|nr:L-tyrosine/L-tryptophan isonitrile synthase family protein [Candidatus Daviesbacteria bacterium]